MRALNFDCVSTDCRARRRAIRVPGVMRSTSVGCAMHLASVPNPAWAHTTGSVTDGAFAWAVDPLGAALLALLAGVYASGQWRLARRGHSTRGASMVYFWVGWLALLIALAPPLEGWTEVSFAAHMAQHEIMMLVAAPLLVLARPLGTLLWGLPSAFASIAKSRTLRAFAAGLSAPLTAWIVHAAILWGWHVPIAFEAALKAEAVHWLQHSSFFAAAVIFWWSVFHGSRAGGRRGIALLSVFTTAIHTTVLGVLLTFSGRIWYPGYAHAANPWALSPLEDQQLGGLIMSVPGGMVFVVAGLVVTA